MATAASVGTTSENILRGSERVLLKAAEEECLVAANRPSQSKAIHVAAENGLGRLVQLIDVGNRVEALGLIAPQQCSVQAVCPGLGDDVEDAAAGAAELDAKVAGLHRHLLDGVGDVEGLRDAGEGDFIVLGAVQQIVIRARALAVHREPRCPSSTCPYTEYCPQAR